MAALDTLLTQCCWPELAPPYEEALHEAVAFILSRFEPLGIVASGTIIRGNPRKTSDLDIYVIHDKPQRQRIQRFFNGVPAEIFVNPVKAVEGYFAEEQADARPITAHMLATGFIILDRDPVVEQLRQQARELLQRPPMPTEKQLLYQRYGIATHYEDALDMVEMNPTATNMMLGLVVYEMLHYHFRKAGLFLPRDKDLLDSFNGELADLAREFFSSGDLNHRLVLAKQIARQTIEASGFFEWEMPLEDV
jgi:predicted nucleotidyltransferase